MERVKLTAVVQIADQNTSTVKNESIEFSLERSLYERVVKMGALEEEIIEHVKRTVYLNDYEFINSIKRCSVA